MPYLLHGVHTHTGSVDLDLVSVHCGVRHQDLCILDALRLADADLLVQNETLVQEGVLSAERMEGTRAQPRREALTARGIRSMSTSANITR